MADIFVSYCHEDKAKAEKLAHLFESQGWSVFWDKSIPPGKAYDKFINDELEKAQCIVVLWSQMSVASDWVKEEATRGIRRSKLVPILIDSTEPPLGFGRIEAAELAHWNGEPQDPELINLLNAIASITSPPFRPNESRVSPRISTPTATTGEKAPLKKSRQTSVNRTPALIAGLAALGMLSLITITANHETNNSTQQTNNSTTETTETAPLQETPKAPSIPSSTTTLPVSQPITSTAPPPPEPITPPAPQPPQPQTGTVIGEKPTKNLRGGPGTDYGITGEINNGEDIIILDKALDRGSYPWYKIRTQSGHVAWIGAHLIARHSQ